MPEFAVTVFFMIFISLSISLLVCLIAYVPASHIVSKSTDFNLSPKQLWQILTNVTEYPRWQRKVEAINIDKYDNQLVFVEYSTNNRHTIVVQHEAIPFQRLVRAIEDADILSQTYGFKKSTPTFKGSWTFDIINESDQTISLKITQQGAIRNPLTRIFHFFVLGYYYRIDRFFNDLHAYIDKEIPEEDVIRQQDIYVSPLQSNIKLEEDQDDEPVIKSKFSEIYERPQI